MNILDKQTPMPVLEKAFAEINKAIPLKDKKVMDYGAGSDVRTGKEALKYTDKVVSCEVHHETSVEAEKNKGKVDLRTNTDSFTLDWSDNVVVGWDFFQDKEYMKKFNDKVKDDNASFAVIVTEQELCSKGTLVTDKKKPHDIFTDIKPTIDDAIFLGEDESVKYYLQIYSARKA
jgi:hypothetical protein